MIDIIMIILLIIFLIGAACVLLGLAALVFIMVWDEIKARIKK